MMKNEVILKDNTIVHCKTRKEAEQLLKWADKNGRRWMNGMPYVETYWHAHKENSCYDVKRGVLFDKDDAISKGYKIIEFYKIKEIK